MPAWLLAAFLSSCAADIATTHIGVAHHATESNAAMKVEAIRDSATVASCASSAFALTRLHQTHPRAADITMLALAALRGVVVAHNVVVIRAQIRLGR